MAASAHGGPARPLRVLVDINVVLDQLLRREPWYTAAQSFWQLRDAGRLVAYRPASAVTDIFYIGRRQAGLAAARRAVERCLREFGLVPPYRAVFEAALALPGSDVEDNVLIRLRPARGSGSHRRARHVGRRRLSRPMSLPVGTTGAGH